MALIIRKPEPKLVPKAEPKPEPKKELKKETKKVNEAKKKETGVQSIIVWYDAGIFFFVVEGDYSHLHHQFMGSSYVSDRIEKQIFDLAYVEGPKIRRLKVNMSRDFPYIPPDAKYKVVVTGNLP